MFNVGIFENSRMWGRGAECFLVLPFLEDEVEVYMAGRYAVWAKKGGVLVCN